MNQSARARAQGAAAWPPSQPLLLEEPLRRSPLNTTPAWSECQDHAWLRCQGTLECRTEGRPGRLRPARMASGRSLSDAGPIYPHARCEPLLTGEPGRRLVVGRNARTDGPRKAWLEVHIQEAGERR